MDVARHQLLARAVLAENEHPAVGRRRRRHLLSQLHHGVALADHRVRRVHPGAQGAVLHLEPSLPQRVADDEDRLLEREWLLHEVEGAHLDGAHGRFDVAVAEMITTCTSISRSRMRASVARPSMPGSQMSSTTTS